MDLIKHYWQRSYIVQLWEKDFFHMSEFIHKSKVITLLKYSLTITPSLYHCSNTLRTLLEWLSRAICQSLLLEEKISLRGHLNQHLTFQKFKLLLWSKFLKRKKKIQNSGISSFFTWYLAPNNKVSSQKKNFIYSNID